MQDSLWCTLRTKLGIPSMFRRNDREAVDSATLAQQGAVSG
jgi:hypothetical protein